MEKRKFFTTACFAFFILSCSKSSEPESFDTFNTRGVQNGIEISSTETRAVGGLVKSDGTLCTATLVCPNVAITAYHCVSGYSADDMRFTTRRGSKGSVVSYSNDWGKAEARGVAIASHKYKGLKASSITEWDGIALVKLDFDEETPSVQIPKLSMNSEQFSLSGMRAKLIGYGQFSENKGAGIRRIGTLGFENYEMPDEEFENLYGNEDPISHVLVRFSPAGDPPTASCTGDSGAPIFSQNGILSAIVLSGSGACGAATNTLGMSVAYERVWLKKQLARWCH